MKTYSKVLVKNVYPGIDWVIYTSHSNANDLDGSLKHEFIVHPNANPNQIKLVYEGSGKLAVKNNQLHFENELGEITEGKLFCYQGNKSKEVVSNYMIKTQDKKTKKGFSCEIGIELGNYNPSESLVIDPQLVWATFYGGNNLEGIMSIDCDANGNLFATGYTGSTNFPIQNWVGAYNNSTSGGAFVLRFTNAGVLTWSTYYNGVDAKYIACDGLGSVYVTGYAFGTLSTQALIGAYNQNISGGGQDVFILRFNAGTGARTWATYYGGSGGDIGYSIAIDGANNVLITGSTSGNFPTLPMAGAYNQPLSGGGNDVFILRFTSAGVLTWATNYGGAGDDIGLSIACDPSGNVCVAGHTSGNFPTLSMPGAYNQAALGGGNDLLILRFTNTGVLTWATYYGGNSTEECGTIACDVAGNIYVMGRTGGGNFPTQVWVGAYNQSFGGGNSWGGDAFILRFTNTGTRIWATYYGGNADEMIGTNDNIETDNCGNVYLSFRTWSTNIYTFGNANCGQYFDTGQNGGADIFIVKLNNSGGVIWATYFGGNGYDGREALAIDKTGSLFIAGEWGIGGSAVSASYPLTNPGGGAYFNPTPMGADDGFIAKFVNVPTYTQSQVNVSGCNCSGSATINISCSNANYSYRWSNGSNTLNVSSAINTVTGLCPGTYTVTAYSGCDTIQANYTITGGSGSISLNTTPINATCATLGSVTADASGGSTPYTYSWKPIGQTTSAITGLNPGTYTVTVTDNNNCQSISMVSITQTTPIIANTSQTSPSCVMSNGSASVSISNSTGGVYTYNWSTGTSSISTSTNNTITNLSSGTYSVTVTQGNCTISTTVTISQPWSLVVKSSAIICPPFTGTATAYTTNGTSPYSYIWSNGQNSAIATGLSSGVGYTVTATDANGCTATSTVIPTSVPMVMTTTSQNISCTTPGQASVSISSGAAPYTFSWSNGFSSSSSTASYNLGLSIGGYTVTITDANGCTTTKTYTITGSSPVSATFTYSTPCLGTVVNFTNTGTLPNAGITYSWVISPVTPSNVSGTSANFSYAFLAAGTYRVSRTVTDVNGCINTIIHNITVNNCSSLTISATGNSICPGLCATVTSTPSGGTSPYTYSWSTGATTKAITPCPLSTTTYTVKVTDASGGTSTSTAVVTINPTVTASITAGLINCSGAATGSATATGGGGTSPYTFSWSTGATTTGALSTIPNLPANTYSVMITDANGCTATTAATLIAPPPLLGQFTKGTAACSNCGCQEWILVNATGGTSPYVYQWPDGYDKRYKNKVCAGNYTVKITDKNGCSVNLSVTTP